VSRGEARRAVDGQVPNHAPKRRVVVIGEGRKGRTHREEYFYSTDPSPSPPAGGVADFPGGQTTAGE
jgi:hypothetical protein